MTDVILEGVTNRGKQLIKEQGTRWTIWRFDENVPCFDGAPALLIAPAGTPWHHNTSRWVRANTIQQITDPAFMVLERLETVYD